MNYKTNLKAAAMAYMLFVLFGTLITIVNANLSTLASHFSVDLTRTSFLISSMAAGRLATLYFSGWLSDKIGRKKMMIAAALCISFFYATLPLHTSFVLAIVTIFLAGAGHGMIDACATALIVDCFPKKSNAAVGLTQAFFSFGCLFPPIVSSFLFRNNLYFGYIFWALALAGIAVMAGASFIKFPEVADLEQEVFREGPKFKIRPSVWIEGLLLSVAVLFYCVAITALTTWVGVYSEEVAGMEASKAMQILFYYNIGCLTGSVVFSRLLKKVHETSLYIILSFLAGASVLTYVLLSDPRIAFTLLTMAGFFGGVIFSFPVSIVSEMFPKNHGKSIGAIMSVTAVATIITPVITKYLYDFAGLASILYFSAGCYFACTMVTIIFKIRYNHIRIRR